MSDNCDDGKKRNNSKLLVEHPENNEASVDVGGSMEGSSIGEPSTAERQVLGAHSTPEGQVKDGSNQTKSARVRALRDKWEEAAKKTYAEMASMLPGGAERSTYQEDSSHLPTMPVQQASDQHFQEGVKNPLQENPEQGLEPTLQGSSNQGCPCQGSNPPAPAEHAKEQQLQGSLHEGGAPQGHFEVMLFAIY